MKEGSIFFELFENYLCLYYFVHYYPPRFLLSIYTEVNPLHHDDNEEDTAQYRCDSKRFLEQLVEDW